MNPISYNWVIFAVAFLLGVVGCEETTYREIPIDGVPTCEGSFLLQPVALAYESNGVSGQLVLSGHQSELSDPQGLTVTEEELEYTLRFGLCRNRMDNESGTYACGAIDWYDSATVVLDGADPSARVSVPPPPTSDCLTVAN